MSRPCPVPIPKRGDFLLQRTPVVEDRVRPLEDALPIGREPVETLTALDDRNAQFLFELPDAAGQRWLTDVTRLSCTGKVLFSREGDQILQLSDVHAQQS
jgi:hypothetical protein